MTGYSNVTFDELEVGTTASSERVLGRTEVEALLLVSGDVVPFHVREDVDRDPNELSVEAVGAEALVSGLLERRLPGPGTRIVSQQFEFSGRIRVGDAVRATVTVREKRPAEQHVVFDCRVEAMGSTVLQGVACVEAPGRKLTYSEIATPEVLLRRNDVFVRLLRRCEPLPAVTWQSLTLRPRIAPRRDRSGASRADRAGAGRTGGADPRAGPGVGCRHRRLPDRRHRAQPCVGGRRPSHWHAVAKSRR